MPTGIFISGVKVAMKGVEKVADKIQEATFKGLHQGAALMFRDSQEHVPYDLGNLSGSGYIRRTRVRGKPTVEIGYTANYALEVHEAVDRNWKKPGATAKFLENAFKEHGDEAVRLARRAAGKAAK